MEIGSVERRIPPGRVREAHAPPLVLFLTCPINVLKIDQQMEKDCEIKQQIRKEQRQKRSANTQHGKTPRSMSNITNVLVGYF